MILTSPRRLRGVLAPLAAAALAASLLTACAADADDKAPTGLAAGTGLVGVTEPAGKPVRGGVLTYADVTEARSLDPAVTYGTASAGGTPLAAVYDVLVRWNPESEAFEPWLAQGLEPNAEHTEWTLTLREGVEFADGTPLDAKAVVASIQRFVQMHGSDAALLQANVERYRAVDAHTVVFTLNKPWATFPNILAQGAGMIVAPAATADPETFTPIGAGPFQLDSYRPQEELLLKANPGYWKGEPYLEGLRFVVPGSSEAAVDGLLNGDNEAALLIYPTDEQRARSEELPGFRGLNNVHPVLWINQREGAAGADPRVRKAIQLATDVALYNQRVDRGNGVPSTELFGETSRWHSDLDEPAEDVAAATALVEEAKADGFDGTLVYVDDTDNRSRNEASAIKPMLERVGFTVKPELISSVAAKMKRIYADHDFDIVTSGLAVQDADPFHRLYSGLASTSLSNLTGTRDPEMDRLLTDLQGAADDTARAAAVRAVEERWYETVPGVPLAASDWYVTWTPKLHGVVPGAEFLMLFGEAWLEQ